MLRAILVDDEEAVLRGLENHVNWQRHGVKLVGAFPNGQEAFEYVRKHPVDLVVTDVRTPYMDGIELAKRVRALYPRTKILFISGHADVGFLKDALKLDAVDYILKSIDLDEMDQTLARVVGMIDEEQRLEKKFFEMEELLTQSMPLLRSRRLSSLLHDSDENESVVLSELQFLGIPLDDRTHYAVVVVRLANKWQAIGGLSEKERFVFSLKIQAICEGALREHDSSVCFKDRMSEYVLIVNAEGENCETTLLDVAASVRERLKDELNVDVSIGISDRFAGVRMIRDAYLSACEAIERRYLIDSALPISVKKYEEVDDIKSARQHAEKELGEAIVNGGAAAVRKALLKVLEGVNNIPSPDERQNFLMFLLLLPTRLLTNLTTHEKGVYASQRRLMERFLLCPGTEEQEALIAKAYDEVAALLLNLASRNPTRSSGASRTSFGRSIRKGCRSTALRRRST